MQRKEKFVTTAITDNIANTLEAKINDVKESDREKARLIAEVKGYMARLIDISFKNLTCPKVVVRWELENKKDYLSVKKEFGQFTFSYNFLKTGRCSAEGDVEEIDYQDASNINAILAKIDEIAPTIAFL